jgi:hypothetical protein
MLERDTNIPEWVQSKITLAEDYITTASNYMQGEMSEGVSKINQKYHAGMDWFSSKEAAMKHAKKMEDQGYHTHYSFRPSSMYNASSHTITHYFRDKDHQNEYRRQKYAEKKKKMSEEVTHSVHVKTYDSHGEKQMNSPDFKKHVTAHGGELDYVSDKGAAFKFKSHSHAAAFHRGVQSKFRDLGSEHDMHEDMAMGTGPVNVAANVADPKNKKLFDKPMKRFKSFKAK